MPIDSKSTQQVQLKEFDKRIQGFNELLFMVPAAREGCECSFVLQVK